MPASIRAIRLVKSELPLEVLPAATNNAPDPPTSLTATANGQTQIDLSWTAPADDGGSAITGYKIEWSEDGTPNWADLVADTGSGRRDLRGRHARRRHHAALPRLGDQLGGRRSGVERGQHHDGRAVTVTVADMLSTLEDDGAVEIAVTATTGIDAPPPRPFGSNLPPRTGRRPRSSTTSP